MLPQSQKIRSNKIIFRKTYLREKLRHKVVGLAHIDGHVVGRIVVVRLGLKNQKYKF